MRVALLTTSFPRFEGDYRGVFVARLVDALREQGLDVDVVEPGGFTSLKRGSGLIPNLKRSWRARLAFLPYCVSFLFVAARAARRCDVIHANWSLSGMFAVLAGRWREKRVVLTERSSLLIGTQNRWINRWLGWVVHGSECVVTISSSARDRLREKFPDIEVEVIPNGVDENAFSRDHRDAARADLGWEGAVPNIVTAGRLTEGKRLDVLLAALRGLAGRGREFRCWLIGGGELEGTLRREIAGIPELSDRVRLAGKVSHREVAKWLSAADIFVLTSAGETGGNVVLESMSAGLAVVSTPVGWAADFIRDGENGIIIPHGDAPALETALDSLITDPALATELGARARQTIVERNLTWPGCARNYIKLYEKARGSGGQ